MKKSCKYGYSVLAVLFLPQGSFLGAMYVHNQAQSLSILCSAQCAAHTLPEQFSTGVDSKLFSGFQAFETHPPCFRRTPANRSRSSASLILRENHIKLYLIVVVWNFLKMLKFTQASLLYNIFHFWTTLQSSKTVRTKFKRRRRFQVKLSNTELKNNQTKNKGKEVIKGNIKLISTLFCFLFWVLSFPFWVDRMGCSRYTMLSAKL